MCVCDYMEKRSVCDYVVVDGRFSATATARVCLSS